jgi:hypothetical protein
MVQYSVLQHSVGRGGNPGRYFYSWSNRRRLGAGRGLVPRGGTVYYSKKFSHRMKKWDHREGSSFSPLQPPQPNASPVFPTCSACSSPALGHGNSRPLHGKWDREGGGWLSWQQRHAHHGNLIMYRENGVELRVRHPLGMYDLYHDAVRIIRVVGVPA